MKVIFVDVDGVLNSDDFIDSVKGKQDIDIKTVLLLKRAIEETGAKIVMDTSFRYTQSFLKVQEMLLQNGIMFDKTDIVPLAPRAQNTSVISSEPQYTGSLSLQNLKTFPIRLTSVSASLIPTTDGIKESFAYVSGETFIPVLDGTL